MADVGRPVASKGTAASAVARQPPALQVEGGLRVDQARDRLRTAQADIVVLVAQFDAARIHLADVLDAGDVRDHGDAGLAGDRVLHASSNDESRNRPLLRAHSAVNSFDRSFSGCRFGLWLTGEEPVITCRESGESGR